MSYRFTVSPDFGPRFLSAWYIFNTWMQRQLGEAIHLELFDSFAQQRAAIEADAIDLIYANPYDASSLVRQHGFRGVAAPKSRSDEALLVVPASGPITDLQGFRAGMRASCTDDPDVQMMGWILLEPVDLGPADLAVKTCDSYVLVAKDLLSGAADLGLFLEAAFEELSEGLRRSLRVVRRSRIQVVRHALMAGRRFEPSRKMLATALVAMGAEPKSQAVLEGLGIASWEPLDDEEVEFMIDLIDTLVARPA